MGARSYNGGSAATTLNGGIASGSTTIAVTDASTWPSSGAFSIVLDRGLAGEEKILVASRSGNTLTVTTRGYDGTSAAAHLTGATAECCGTAIDFQEANDHTNATTNVHGLSGGAAVVGTTQSQTLTNKTLTTPTIGDFTNAQHTHQAAASGGSVLSGLTNSTFAATLSGSGYAIGNGTIACRYFQIGKLVFVHYLLTWGTTSTRGTGGPILTLPVAADTALQPVDASFRGFLGLHGAAKLTDSTSTTTPIAASLVTGGSTIDVIFYDTGTSPAQAAAAGSGNVFLNAQATGWFELSGWYIAA